MSQDTKARRVGVGATGRFPEAHSRDAASPSKGNSHSGTRRERGRRVADTLAPLLNAVLAPETPVRFEFWDKSALGPVDGPGVVRLRSADAIRHLLWAPGELGLSRAYVAGALDIEGDLYETLRVLEDSVQGARIGMNAIPSLWRGAVKLGLLGGPPRRPSEEARPRGRLHTRSRDSEAVSHHYDVGNDFYRTVLGPSMTYSCARFVDDEATLEMAQAAKHDLICRKLGLGDRSNMTLLDVGCGWGSMAIHAASGYGAEVVGITLSKEQAALARRRVDEAGLSNKVEIRLQDYRDAKGENFDAISSIGMFEHVGSVRVGEYLAILWGLLSPGGRLLNHAISTPGGSKIGSRSFIGRYVFPDGELMDVGQLILDMEKSGFEVRDVESLREHYSRTLHAWIQNLRAGWVEAVSAAGEARARIWLLYMAASANGFDDGGLAVHQVLGVKPSGRGDSGMPSTRRAWG
jgi:cyclopropane-fatty-acyl-phospholipid synthase